MHSEIEIQRKDYGFVVCVISESEEDNYRVEEYALEDRLDVLAEVLRWLGYDEDTRDAVIEMLDEDVAYELTDKGHETLARLEHERAELERLEHERAYQAWETQRAAALKRGSGRGLLERGTRDYWHTTSTGTDKGQHSRSDGTDRGVTWT